MFLRDSKIFEINFPDHSAYGKDEKAREACDTWPMQVRCAKEPQLEFCGWMKPWCCTQSWSHWVEAEFSFYRSL